MGKRIPFIDRFWSKVDTSAGPDACWPWMAARHYKGYGEVRVYQRKAKAHRVAFEMSRGEIPAGMMVDHMCHNRAADCVGGDECPHRACCNPEHLALATARENSLRSATSTGGINARRTHCPKGHEYTPENTLLQSDAGRLCRECLRLNSAQQRANEIRLCTHPDCSRVLAHSGLCSMHVSRKRRGHDMDAPAYRNYRPGLAKGSH